MSFKSLKILLFLYSDIPDNFIMHNCTKEPYKVTYLTMLLSAVSLKNPRFLNTSRWFVTSYETITLEVIKLIMNNLKDVQNQYEARQTPTWLFMYDLFYEKQFW